MGIDLCGAGGYAAWNMRGWQGILALGHRYGWVPAGTEPPSLDEIGERWHDPWSGTYFSNQGQLVTAEDAQALADALDRALPDIPDQDAVAHKMITVARLYDGTVLRAPKPGVELSLLEAYSGEGKERLREFIAFCRPVGSASGKLGWVSSATFRACMGRVRVGRDQGPSLGQESASVRASAIQRSRKRRRSTCTPFGSPRMSRVRETCSLASSRKNFLRTLRHGVEGSPGVKRIRGVTVDSSLELIRFDLEHGTIPQGALVKPCCWRMIGRVRSSRPRSISVPAWMNLCRNRGCLLRGSRRLRG